MQPLSSIGVLIHQSGRRWRWAALSKTRQRPANARKVRIMRIARFICSLLLAVGLLAIPAQSRAQVAVGISVRIGPPVLPVYVQPICPGPGYLWVPGYWAYGPDDYFWVPGTWVFPPEVGLLWTPGYWGWEDTIPTTRPSSTIRPTGSVLTAAGAEPPLVRRLRNRLLLTSVISQ